jgi:threonine/homoserine/homoserine lactone efflux protein
LTFNIGRRTIGAMTTLLDFLAVATVALVIPGPDTFVVLRTTLAGGRRAGTVAAAGSGAGNLRWGTASVLGVAAMLAASQTAFAALRFAGAAYVVVLGVQALRAAARREPLAAQAEPGEGASLGAAFRRGLASDLLNVKVGLFWMALVPQFLHAGGPALLPALMVGAMGLLVFAWLAAYAGLAARVSAALQRGSWAVAVNGAVGVVLVVLGAGLAVAG